MINVKDSQSLKSIHKTLDLIVCKVETKQLENGDKKE